MSIVDTKPFMRPIIQHNIFAHTPPVTENQVWAVGVASIEDLE